MTSVAGKKPQDIYDAGASQAAEIEKTSSDSLNLKASLATKQSDQIDADVSKILEDKSNDIVAELKETKRAYLEQIQKTIEDEVRETNAHLVQVSNDLENLASRLKRQISSLKSSHGEDVNALTENLAEEFGGFTQQTQRELEKADFDASSSLRAKGNAAITAVQQKLDQSLWETRGEERQYNSVFFKNFMKKANIIDIHFSALMQELSEDFAKHNGVLKNQAEKTDTELQKEAEYLVKQIKTQEIKYEREINDFFNHESVEHGNRLDNSLNSITYELSTMHDVTTNKLSEQTQILSTDLLKASSDVKLALNERCLELKTHLTKSMSDFKVKLHDRTEHSQLMKEGLEEEKQKLFADLKTELTSIKDGFEKNLESMVLLAVKKVIRVGQEAEDAITIADERCTADLEKCGFAAKKDIDETIYRFLDVIAEQKAKALEEIAKAAVSSNKPVDTPKQIQPVSTSISVENDVKEPLSAKIDEPIQKYFAQSFEEDSVETKKSIQSIPAQQTEQFQQAEIPIEAEQSTEAEQSIEEPPFDLNFINFGDSEDHHSTAEAGSPNPSISESESSLEGRIPRRRNLDQTGSS